MSNSVIKKIALFTAALVALLATFWLGGYVAFSQVMKSVHGTQAKLAFRHLIAYEEVHSYLDAGCTPQAKARLVFLMDQQKMLMAEYVQSAEDMGFEEYVSLRYPELIDELRDYDIDWEKELRIRGCNNNEEAARTGDSSRHDN